MNQTNKTLAIALCAMLVLTTFFEVHAQQRLSYSGKYRLSELNGQAEYGYQVIGIDTLYEGPFVFERSDLNSLLQQQDSSFLIKGAFEKSVPQGKWLFQFGNFQSDSSTKVTGFNYSLIVNGTLQEARGDFFNGKLYGRWEFFEKHVKNSTVVDTLFYSEVNFLNSVPQQTFRLENKDGALVGRLLRNGLAHDTWSFISNEGDAIENWYFNEGRLLKIEKEENNALLAHPVFGTMTKAFEEENLDAGYILLINIYKGNAALPKTSHGIETVLLQNHSRYEKIKKVLADLGTNGFATGFRVKVPHFPLDEKSKEQLDSTSRWVKQVQNSSEIYLKSTQLNILRRSDPEANYLFHVTKALDSQLIKPLALLSDMNDYGVIDNVDEVTLINYLFPKGKPIPEISFIMSDGTLQTYLGPGGENADFSAAGIKGTFQIAAYLKESMESISARLDSKFINNIRQREFEDLEKQMVTQVDALGSYPDSIQQNLSKEQNEALISVKTFAEGLLSAYSEKEGKNKNLDEAKYLVQCLGQLDLLSDEIVRLSENEKIVEEKYTDAVFNPFTATIMDERVKKRITGAYRNIIVPYLLETAARKVSCETVESLYQLYVQVQERMLELRDEESTKMERKLRKERNPKTVLELFGLKPVGK
ncbi:MAG: hypothetical protein ACFB0A_08435 [Croceivirga sp.]